LPVRPTPCHDRVRAGIRRRADDSDNLAWRAAELLGGHIGLPPTCNLEVINRSRGGGLAGGSTDAAGTLLACAELWQIKATRADLMELAAQIGSDRRVRPARGTALGTGRGEILLPSSPPERSVGARDRRLRLVDARGLSRIRHAERPSTG